MWRGAYRGRPTRRLKMEAEGSTPLYPRAPVYPRVPYSQGVFAPGTRPVMGVKRRLPGTVRRVKRVKREAAGGGASRQLTYEKRQYGRRPKQDLKQAYKILNSSTDSYIIRWSRINDMRNADNPFGALTLANQQYDYTIGGTNYSDIRYPVHLYDITSCINAATGGIETAASPAFELCRVKNAGDAFFGGFEFRRIMGKLPDGTDGTTWNKQVVESFYEGTPGQRSILEWLDLKMVMYGTRKAPTKYYIDLVQFNELADDPHHNLSVSNVSSVGKDLDEALYTYLTKPLIYNPISDTSIPSRKRYRILQSWTHEFNPDESTNLDIAPAQKVFKCFKRFNRTCKWGWNPRVDVDNSDVVNEMLDKYDTNVNQNETILEPKARIYLMVRAANWNRAAPYTGGTTWNKPANSDIDPTYDINIKVKHLFQL